MYPQQKLPPLRNLPNTCTTLKRSEPSSSTLQNPRNFQNPRTSHTLQKLDFLKNIRNLPDPIETLQNHAAAFQT